jgi:hypothetical protein
VLVFMAIDIVSGAMCWMKDCNVKKMEERSTFEWPCDENEEKIEWREWAIRERI